MALFKVFLPMGTAQVAQEFSVPFYGDSIAMHGQRKFALAKYLVFF